MFENQPKGLFALALANTGERFGYYTMLAVFALFLRANYGLDAGWAGEIYSDFLMLVYFLPIVGGWLADKFGFGRMVTIGILIMFAGYLLLSINSSWWRHIRTCCDAGSSCSYRFWYRSFQG